ncbi:hypothetical protein K443DRAFT_389093 [Laccaria amethystina LaAM-08-1]|uniref:Uncharacterized protein n=1 Tax=Laccaria amethystina LaAM-08-1 TaxID=1095629 RepID=A0A0C9XB93_9AGAR|nr:hypothetical protein K443DRAFT_389093 [Laccaria amethystina LaAM-08-1]
MGSHPSVSTKKSHGKAASRPETKKTTPHVPSDKHSTEAIAMQLLEPNVSESCTAGISINVRSCWMLPRPWENAKTWRSTSRLFEMQAGRGLIGQKTLPGI